MHQEKRLHSLARYLSGGEKDDFLDFVSSFLHWLPEDWLTPSQAYLYPWLQGKFDAPADMYLDTGLVGKVDKVCRQKS